jgi:hypothetical protein
MLGNVFLIFYVHPEGSLKKKNGNSLVFYKTGGGGYPPLYKTKPPKDFPFFFEEKTENWTKLGGGTPPLVKNQTISCFLLLKASLTAVLGHQSANNKFKKNFFQSYILSCRYVVTICKEMLLFIFYVHPDCCAGSSEYQ